MRRHDFYYDLPEELIAKEPTRERTGSRLMYLDGRSGRVDDRHFADILEYLKPGDLMVFNDTKVIPARLFAQKDTGGKVEILIERVVSTGRALAHVKASKSPRTGTQLILDDGTSLRVEGRRGALFELHFPGDEPVLTLLDRLGHVPLPPYIDRADNIEDRSRYQTVYGAMPGAVAAPTAGLHFDDALIEKIRSKGVDTAFVTLHVGAGTFQPVRVDDIREHQMHTEVMVVSDDVCRAVEKAQANGGRIVAVGTTSVRCLETAGQSGRIEPYQGETNIFIYPSYRFKVVDCLITNFHLPESTLIMLVSAFAGYQNTMSAYRHAVAEKYRFFSYGDAMFIERNNDAV